MEFIIEDGEMQPGLEKMWAISQYPVNQHML